MDERSPLNPVETVHVTLFKQSIIVNLRSASRTNPRVVYQLTCTGGKTLLGQPKIRCTLVDSMFEEKNHWVLHKTTGKCDVCAEYGGWGKDMYSKKSVLLRLIVRTDVTDSERRDGIIAGVVIIKKRGRFLRVESVGRYVIYSPEWEVRHEVCEPSY